MTPYETAAVVYFCVLSLASWTGRADLRRRFGVSAIALAMAAVAVSADALGEAARPWLGHGYLLAGYWLPALLVTPRNGRFEAWLHRTDRAIRQRLPIMPSALAHLAELAYLFCYPLVPFAFLIVWINGSAGDVGRFWTSVLCAGYACYGTLPWLVSRPPRQGQGPPAAIRSPIAGFNAQVLDHVSHGFTTFPSGHVAVAAAAAAMVAPVSPPAAAALGIVVVLICVGAAAGGYHYVVDVVAGAGVAAVAIALASTV